MNDDEKSETFGLRLVRFLRRLRKHYMGVGGAMLIAVICGGAIFAPVITEYAPNKIAVRERVQGPNADHVLGTDELGRDVFSRLLYGARPSLVVAVVATLLSTVLGSLLGLLAAINRSVLRAVIMSAMDILFAFPAVLFALVLMTVLGTSLINLIIALTVIYLPRIVRVVYASALQVVELDYVSAAVALGAGKSRILLRHVLPNVAGPLIVQATLGFSLAILAEATLSFLGLGVQPPEPSWGAMLNAGRPFLEVAPWLAIYPTLAISLAVLGFNLLGDALRDWLDPRLKDV
ncbi:MAG: ABC-type dipeptide/oligopeptide/nickel transport system, permease component [Rhizobium sp.]|nr:ABC-type dipeptide/oligopeptide/nickel transport system, permease component [Rhizobium sp.]